jgi:hypothetical protein
MQNRKSFDYFLVSIGGWVDFQTGSALSACKYPRHFCVPSSAVRDRRIWIKSYGKLDRIPAAHNTTAKSLKSSTLISNRHGLATKLDNKWSTYKPNEEMPNLRPHARKSEIDSGFAKVREAVEGLPPPWRPVAQGHGCTQGISDKARSRRTPIGRAKAGVAMFVLILGRGHRQR